MNTTSQANWEETLLNAALSQRARRTGAVYTGPGSASNLPHGLDDPIVLTAGVPDPAALPVDDLAAAAETVLRREGAIALEYGGAQGFLGLRAFLAAYWSPIEGISLTPECFSLTVGSAHALDNVCGTFLDEGDTVLVESPSFPGSIRVIRSAGSTIEPVPVDEEGLIVDAVEEKLKGFEAAGRRVKALYTIPTYHNPTGTALSIERRQRLVELCQTHGVLIIEDNAYGELGFESGIPPSLYSIAGGKGVVKLGTFSKTVATGLRAGWIQAPPSFVNATLATRFDMGQSPFLLRTLAEYVDQGRLEAHVAASRQLYRRKRDLMLAELAERCAPYATWTEPPGGFFVWLRLAEGLESLSLRARAEAEGVYVSGGPTFFVDPETEPMAYRNIRLAFSYAPEEQIGEAVRRLARAMQASVDGR